ncbi:PLASTID-SPECIFIC RIBOSOMAL protein 4 [Tripterygium wilfordii]|uniref:PLASTID-SPECIFIC RIBOSOMAL protein 4 n=1 Tax=Tripterygium wilfordii TaxID=458696 RepID=A0A7J7DMU9_TRIWF|nr:30S ribosomal protein S31, chloroplastic-like [Tripterygium wilfordii]KAF5747613.1 PLASTID-SPECIFIC RIBOSOMAL protein 4 [Tripterygium wilfordii]
MASLITGVRPPPMTPQCLSLSSRFSSSQSSALGLPLCDSTSSLSLSATPSSSVPFVYCGRGDRKTAKGKRFNHSFGNARPRDKKKGRGPPRVPLPPSAPKKDLFEDTDVVRIEIDE